MRLVTKNYGVTFRDRVRIFNTLCINERSGMTDYVI